MTIVDHKKCRQCKQLLPLSMYGKEMGTVGLKKTACKKCLNENGKGAKQARKALRDRPSIGHKCLCGKVYTGTRPGREWVPDHDNKTNRARGWLCRECNTTLGKVKDDPRIVGNLLIYLVQHGKRIPVQELVAQIQQAETQHLRSIVSP